MELSIVFLPLVLSFLFHLGTHHVFVKQKRFDDFNHRSSHKTVATRTGGISIFSTLFVISLIYYFLKIELFDYSLFIPLGILFTMGFYDDIYQADFKIKFLMQLIVAKILIDQGFAITNMYGLLGIYEIPWLISQIITSFTFVIFVNAYNFIDGVDGLAISETIKNLCFFLIFLSSNSEFYNFILILIFACLPFYYFNFKKKRKVFLGDAGSLFLGGVNIILLFHLLNPDTYLDIENSVNKFVLALAVLLYPLMDLLRVVIIRLRNKKSPFNADQNHIHHWFISRGFSHIMTSFIIVGSGTILLLLFVLYI